MAATPSRKAGPLRFRYRVVIHPGDTAEANLESPYNVWTKSLSK
ncbi:MAG: hypothetical protein QM757_43885 [Paludibaculum sp.]